MTLAVEQNDPCARAGSTWNRCAACDLNISFETGLCTSHQPPFDSVLIRLQAGAATRADRRFRRTKVRLRKIAFAAVILISLCVPAFAESRRIMDGSAGGNKYQFFYDTFLDPS